MKKRRLWGLMIVTAVTLAFSGCGKGDNSQKPIEEIDFSNIAEQVPEKQEEVILHEESSTVVEPTVEEENTEGKYRSELTNEWIDEALMNQRPVAIMVDNEKTALPHYGVSEADVVYELMNSTANGRITRLMCIVKDWEKISQFGSIRSTRPTNILLAAEWNAILVHDGGPFYIDAYLKNPYADHLSGGFARINNGKAREFTEYVTTGELATRISSSKIDKEYNKYYSGAHFNFSAKEVDFSSSSVAKDAKEIKLPYSHNGSMLKYNENTKTYDYYEYGDSHKDAGNDNKVTSFKNVLIQECTFHQYDDNGYMIFNCIDAGREGYYITNGKAIPVIWNKLGDTDVTKYVDKSTGKEIEINTGKTYVTLVPSDSWKNVEIK